jgi:chemotaxis signal transduction protein
LTVPPALAVDLVTDSVVQTDESSDPAILFQAFRVGALWCYTGFDEASELVEPLTPAWLPNTPAWFKGLAHLNGYVVPVIDLVHAAKPVAGAADDQSQQKPLFHILFGRQQQRLAVAIHSLPFTVTSHAKAQPVPSDLTSVWSEIVDEVLPWTSVSHTAGSSVGQDSQVQPDRLHHLNGVLLERWFAVGLHAR